MDTEFVCYHITTKDKLPAILQDGLKPNSQPSWFKSKAPYVMLSKYPYWWLYDKPAILIEIKDPKIKPEYFIDPEGLRWDKVVKPKYFNAIIDISRNKYCRG